MSGSGGDQALNFLYLLGCLVLVISALMVRRIPVAHGLKILAGWILIFGAAFIAFSLKDDFLALGRRILDVNRGEGEVVRAGAEIRIPKAEDGHFWVNARVNGTRVRFLIDSGATVTTLSAEAAREADVEPSPGFPVMVDTANGQALEKRAVAARLAVGSIERRDFDVHLAAESAGDTNVLGMNFLSSLAGWGVQGNMLVLKP
ncbi:MAG: aspartyl protease family protein [Sphingomonadales bacterium]|nr:aspartyl protease family protein [Sphingomonadales bacterium]